MILFCPRMETLNEQFFFFVREGKGVDNASHWSTHYPRDSVVGFVSEQPWLGNYVLEKRAHEPKKKNLTATARLRRVYREKRKISCVRKL